MEMHTRCGIGFLCIFTGLGIVAAPIGASLADSDIARRQNPDFVSVFDCSGSIMHQSYKGAIDSPLKFWFGVAADNRIVGQVTDVGAPLDLPGHAIAGHLAARHDARGNFVGGRMTLDWPFANAGRPIQAALMRETFIRVGHKANGIGKVVRRASHHTYIAGTLWFDPRSHPSLTSFYRVSFISATCIPQAAAHHPLSRTPRTSSVSRALWGWFAALAIALAGCADERATPQADAPIDVAVVVPPPPPASPPKPDTVAHFECDGAILHQSISSKTESPVRFRFDVRSDQSVVGTVVAVGPPLNLPGGELAGHFIPRFDADNRSIGGNLTLAWPYTDAKTPVAFRVMRETFIRAGQSIDGVGHVIRRTSAHTYLAAQIDFDSLSHPALAGFNRASFIQATCTPKPDFPSASR